MEKANSTRRASDCISEEWLQQNGFIPHEDGTLILIFPVVTDIATQPVKVICCVHPENKTVTVWLEQPPEEEDKEGDSMVFLNCLPENLTMTQLTNLISALSPHGTNASNPIDNA